MDELLADPNDRTTLGANPLWQLGCWRCGCSGRGLDRAYRIEPAAHRPDGPDLPSHRHGVAPVPAQRDSRRPALSPDGRRVAYVSDRGGSPQVWVQPSTRAPVLPTPARTRSSRCAGPPDGVARLRARPRRRPAHRGVAGPPGRHRRCTRWPASAPQRRAAGWLPGRAVLAVTETDEDGAACWSTPRPPGTGGSSPRANCSAAGREPGRRLAAAARRARGAAAGLVLRRPGHRRRDGGCSRGPAAQHRPGVLRPGRHVACTPAPTLPANSPRLIAGRPARPGAAADPACWPAAATPSWRRRADRGPAARLALLWNASAAAAS